jgi:caffeoyl-CoA O-methyltransferase
VITGVAARPVTPVGILAAMLTDLVLRLEAAGTDAVLVEELRGAAALAGGLDPYVEQCTTAESADLRAIAAHTSTERWADRDTPGPAPLEQEMLSGHVEGQLLQMLVHATRAVRVLEVGMFTGYSALAMAEAVPDEGVVVACEVDPQVAEIARAGFARSPSGAKVDVRVGPASETLAALRGEQFDLVFIDADKVSYHAYFEAALDLLSPHGLICVDNTLMQGQPWSTTERSVNGQAIAAFNDTVAADPRVAQVIVPLRDGLTLIRRVA